METVTISKSKYEKILRELRLLRQGGVYRRLLEFEKNIAAGKKFARTDLGF